MDTRRLYLCITRQKLTRRATFLWAILIMRNFDLDEDETFEQAVSEAFLETTIPNLRILPASQSDRAIEGWFHEQVFTHKLPSPYSILADIIDAVKDEFDIIIIDTPPSRLRDLQCVLCSNKCCFPVINYRKRHRCYLLIL
ncbi:ParA family protein [Vibrio alginolyticus]|uniref:ParA family protein n=1 Tax=Vibrio alginolyticus TaxID=663 RepID=UPI001EEE7C6C|nr:AAA family ATPase [Vibrio alginolyticus]